MIEQVALVAVGLVALAVGFVYDNFGPIAVIGLALLLYRDFSSLCHRVARIENMLLAEQAARVARWKAQRPDEDDDDELHKGEARP